MQCSTVLGIALTWANGTRVIGLRSTSACTYRFKTQFLSWGAFVNQPKGPNGIKAQTLGGPTASSPTERESRGTEHNWDASCQFFYYISTPSYLFALACQWRSDQDLNMPTPLPLLPSHSAHTIPSPSSIHPTEQPSTYTTTLSNASPKSRCSSPHFSDGDNGAAWSEKKEDFVSCQAEACSSSAEWSRHGPSLCFPPLSLISCICIAELLVGNHQLSIARKSVDITPNLPEDSKTSRRNSLTAATISERAPRVSALSTCPADPHLESRSGSHYPRR